MANNPRYVTFTKKKDVVANRTDICTVLLSASSLKTDVAPKAKTLLKFIDTSILEYQVNTLKAFMPEIQIVVVVGFDEENVLEEIDRLGVFGIINESFDKTNTSRSLSLALRAYNPNHLLMIHGDILFTHQTLSKFSFHKSETISSNKMKSRKVGIAYQDAIATNFDFSFPEKWGQIAYITDKELQILKSLVHNRENDRCSMFQILNKLIDRQGNITVIKDESPLFEVDVYRDISNARQEIV